MICFSAGGSDVGNHRNEELISKYKATKGVN